MRPANQMKKKKNVYCYSYERKYNTSLYNIFESLILRNVYIIFTKHKQLQKKTTYF